MGGQSGSKAAQCVPFLRAYTPNLRRLAINPTDMGENRMFKTTPATEPAPVKVALDELIPLSVLELDLPAPAAGWLIELDRRGIEVVTDDLGRASITRADARQLFDEHREAEARAREVAARQERQAIEADRQWREQLPSGTPWWQLPVGVSAAEVWAKAEKDAKPKRRTPLEDALAGGGMVYRPLQDEEAS
jgi:hypothetical protein